MVHVSQMSTQYVRDPQEIVHIGDHVKVRVIEIDQQGRINLSMLFGEDGQPVEKKPFEPRERGHEEGNRESQPREYTPRVGGREFHDRPKHPLVEQFRREQESRQSGNRNFNRNKRSY